MQFQRHTLNFGPTGVTLVPINDPDAIEAAIDLQQSADEAAADEQIEHDQSEGGHCD